MSKKIGSITKGKIYLGKRLSRKLINIFTDAVIFGNDAQAESLLRSIMEEDTDRWLAHCRAMTPSRLLPGPVGPA